MAERLRRYREYRDEMKTGDVIACQGFDLGARIIRKVTKSLYSHVGLLVRFTEASVDRVFVLESLVEKGVLLWPLSRKLSDYNGKAWWLPLRLTGARGTVTRQKKIRTRILRMAMEQLGKQYDLKAIKYMATKYLLRNKRIPEESHHEFICSELVAYVFDRAALLPPDLKTSDLTPGDITALPCMGEPEEILT